MQDSDSPVWTATEAITWLAFGQQEKAASVEAADEAAVEAYREKIAAEERRNEAASKAGKKRRHLLQAAVKVGQAFVDKYCDEKFDAAMRQILNALRAGQLEAFGLRVGNEEEGYRVIPRETWMVSWVFRSDRLEPDDAADINDWMIAREARESFCNIRFYQSSIRAIAPEPISAFHASKEVEARGLEIMAALMNAEPTSPLSNAELQRRSRLTGRPFKRAKEGAIERTGATAWEKPGRKSTR